MINTGLGTILFGIFFSLFCHVELCKPVEFIDPWNSYTTFTWPYYATVEDTQRIMFTINYLQTHFECDPSTYFCLNTLNFDVIYQDPTDVFAIFLVAPLEQCLLQFRVEHVPLKFPGAKGLICSKCCRWFSNVFPEVGTSSQGNILQMLANLSLTCFLTYPPWFVCALIPFCRAPLEYL